MRKTLSCIIYLSLALLLVVSPSSAQVVHENPADLYPSYDITIQEELNYLIESMQFDLEAISEEIQGRNFSIAKEDFAYYNATVDEYRDLLWRMNLSEPVYQSIVENLNFTRYELRDFILHSEAYDADYVDYTNAVARGDTAAANASAQKARASYERLLSSYDRLRSNTTAIERVLEDNNIDKARYEMSLNNINDFMGRLSVKYGVPGYNATGGDLTLIVEPGTAEIGDTVLITTNLKHDPGTSIENTEVNIYFNNVLAGQYRTDPLGSGSMAYVIPANATSDLIGVHAEAAVNGTRLFSNDALLRIKDIRTVLTLEGNRTEISYGDRAHFRGTLTTGDGAPLAGRTIYIVLNDEDLDTVVTDLNGSYAFNLKATPYMSERQNILYTAYDRSANGIYLSSLSEDIALAVLQVNTTLTLTGGTPLYVGDNGLVNGTLMAGNNIPVEGADVVAYLDGLRIGNGTTDALGAFSIVVWIPSNLSAGTHALQASFDPGESRSLGGASSGPSDVVLGESARSVAVAGLPIAIFQGDRLDIHGTISAGSGIPLAGQKLDIAIEGVAVASAVSDASGQFNYTYTVGDDAPMGLVAVRINESADGARPAVVLYTGQVLVVPINKFLAFSAPLLIIAIFFLAVPLVLRARKDLKGPGPVLIDVAGAAKKPEKAGPPKMPATDVHKALSKPIDASPPPLRTEALRAEAPGMKPPAPPQSSSRPSAVPFDLVSELDAIRALIAKNDSREALSRAYLASRKVAAASGLAVPDSMTHTEFYGLVRTTYPASAQFLLSVLRSYETVIFAGIAVQASDLSLAANGLASFYESLKGEKKV